MPIVGGPKGPGPKNPALARFLEAEKQKRVPRQPASEGRQAQAPVQDRFADVPGMSPGSAHVPGGLAGARPGHDAFSVRLSTLTGVDMRSGSGPAEQARGPRASTTPEGRVLEGDVTLRKAADLELLKGVVALKGDLDISEALVSDLSALSSLRRVEGSLSVEGSASVTSLDGLGALEEVAGNLYLAFCDGLERVSLPALREVKGAFIVEGNAALAALELPGLEQVGGYLHLHENLALADVSLAALVEVGGELSILDNPLLVAVDMRALERLGGEIEMLDNGAKALRGLPLLS